MSEGKCLHWRAKSAHLGGHLPTVPSDWVELASGEEVQLVLWQCGVCDGVYNYRLVKLLVDTDDYDPDDPLSVSQAECAVCSFCQQRERGRFKSRGDMGLF